MLNSPVFTLLTASLLTASNLALLPLATKAIARPSTPLTETTRTPLAADQPGGFRQPGWLIADDDDDDDDDKKGRGRFKQGDDDDDDKSERRSVKVTLQRAKNLARQAAEQANGGLRRYRAEASMHGPASAAPCVDNGNSWTFTFLGGAPGWRTATIESVVTVYKATSVVRVDYNGAVRTASQKRQWQGNLKLARWLRQNALVLQLDVLDKPVTRSAAVFYELFARQNNRWVSVYRSSTTQLVATAGRVNLQPLVIPLNQIRLTNADWSRTELKAIAYTNVGSQTIVLREVVQRWQSIAQINTIQQINTVPVTIRKSGDDDDDD